MGDVVDLTENRKKKKKKKKKNKFGTKVTNFLLSTNTPPPSFNIKYYFKHQLKKIFIIIFLKIYNQLI